MNPSAACTSALAVDPEFAELLEELSNKLQSGHAIDLSMYVDRFPHFAEQLEQLVPAMQGLCGMGGLAEKSEANLRPEGTTKPAEKQLGDFRILHEIGRGGMGVVYEAEQLSLARRVALKVLPFAGVLDQRQLQRFQNEARAAATLCHPHIVPIYFVGHERGVHFFAMQLIDGRTVAQLIDELRHTCPPPPLTSPNRDPSSTPQVTTSQPRAPVFGHADNRRGGGTKDVETTAMAKDRTHRLNATSATSSSPHDGSREESFRAAARLIAQAATALDYAHAHGVVHRDVKPGNLLLDRAGDVWISDFGLARLEGDAGVTMTGDLLGTLRYMSPEQALAKRVPIDHRCDIYSLGVTLYELVTLQPAFDGVDRQEILRQIAFDTPRAPRKIQRRIPVDLETITLKAMAKSPNDRYQTAAELSEDLQSFLDHHPIKARPPSLAERALKWSGRNRLLVACTAVLLVTISVASAVTATTMWRQERRTAVALQESKAAVNFLAHLLSQAKPKERANDEPVTVREVLDDAAELIDDKADRPSPRVEALLRRTIGSAYNSLGLHAQAEVQLRRALSLHEEIRQDDVETGYALTSLGQALYGSGKLMEAHHVVEQVCDMRRRALGHDHPETLKSMANLAVVLNQLGRSAESVVLEREILAIEKARYPPDDPRVVKSMHNLAATLDMLGEYEEALALFEEVHRQRLQSVGSTHVNTLLTRLNMATVLHHLGENQQALEIYEETVDPLEQTLGENHHSTLWAKSNYARQLDLCGQHDQAIEVLEPLVEQLAATKGWNHPVTSRSIGSLGQIYISAGQFDDAQNLFQRSVDDHEARLGPDAPQTLRARHNLACVLKDTGDLKAAKREHRDILARRRQVLSEDDPDLWSSLSELGMTLKALRDYETARQLLEEACGLARQHAGPTSAKTLSYQNNLAIIAKGMNDLNGAEQLFRQVIEAEKSLLGAEHPQTLNAMHNLANVKHRQGKLDEALQRHQQVLKVRRRVLHADHLNLLKSTRCIAKLLAEQGRFQEARPFADATLAGSRRTLGATAPSSLEDGRIKAQVMVGQGESAAAAELAADTLQKQLSQPNADPWDALATRNVLAQAWAGLERKDEARRLWEEALHIAEKTAPVSNSVLAELQSGLAMHLASETVSRDEDWVRGQALAETATELKPYDPTCWRALGMTHARLGNCQEAIDAMQEARSLGWQPALVPAAFVELISSPDSESPFPLFEWLGSGELAAR